MGLLVATEKGFFLMAIDPSQTKDEKDLSADFALANAIDVIDKRFADLVSDEARKDKE